jgi:hypothetical protein
MQGYLMYLEHLQGFMFFCTIKINSSFIVKFYTELHGFTGILSKKLAPI